MCSPHFCIAELRYNSHQREQSEGTLFTVGFRVQLGSLQLRSEEKNHRSSSAPPLLFPLRSHGAKAGLLFE